MKAMLCAFLLTLLTLPASTALARPADETVVQTPQGPVSLDIIHHASFVLHWNGKTIYVDPTGSGDLYAGQGVPDLVLVTHAHGDHLSPKTLGAVDIRNATIVMSQSVADEIGHRFGKAQRVMANGDRFATDGITIDAIPMYNVTPARLQNHPKGWGNGYVLTLGGKRIYISGDTEGTPEMRALKHIDVAFVCMNLPWTMDVAAAAKAVLAFKPGIVYPYHYKGQDTAAFKRLVNASDPHIEVRLRNWYAQ